MIAKRFNQINFPADIIDMKTSKIYHTTTGNDGYELCILLNELHGENERLKSDLAHTKVLLNHLQDKYSGLLKLVHGFNSDVE